MNRPARLDIDTRHGRVAVWLSGPERGDVPGVLLLHANPGDHRDFDAVAAEFARELPVAGVDWPGYGDSSAAHPEEMTADSLGEVAVEVVDALGRRGIQRVAIIGNSVGGYAAVRAAQLRPERVRAVVLVQPAGFTPATIATRLVCRAMGRPALARHLVRPSARAYLGPLRDAGHRAIYERAQRVPDDPVRLAVYCSLWRSLADPRCDLVAEAPLLPHTPVQVVWGTRDPINPWPLNRRGITRAMPHARISTLPTRHEPFSENPILFLDAVRPFLEHRAGSVS